MTVWLIRSFLRQSAIESHDPKKVAQEKDIHTNILKQKSDFLHFMRRKMSMSPFLLQIS